MHCKIRLARKPYKEKQNGIKKYCPQQHLHHSTCDSMFHVVASCSCFRGDGAPEDKNQWRFSFLQGTQLI